MRIRHSCVLIASVAAIAGCGGDDGNDQPVVSPSDAESTRCIPADTSLTTPIANKLTVEGGRIDYGRAVKSDDFENMYFVSAELEGTGLEGRDDVATWATESVGGAEAIYAVDDLAKEHSDWRDGSQTRFKLSLNQDGAKESRDCVTQAAGGGG